MWMKSVYQHINIEMAKNKDIQRFTFKLKMQFLNVRHLIDIAKSDC